MSIFQIAGLAGKRIHISQSKTSPGHVLVQILGADRQPQASLTLDQNQAGNAAGALDVAAREAEAELAVQHG